MNIFHVNQKVYPVKTWIFTGCASKRLVMIILLVLIAPLSLYAKWDGGDVDITNKTSLSIIVQEYDSQCMDGISFSPITLTPGETKKDAYHEEENASGWSCGFMGDSSYYHLKFYALAAPYIYTSVKYQISTGTVSLVSYSSSLANSSNALDMANAWQLISYMGLSNAVQIPKLMIYRHEGKRHLYIIHDAS